MVMWQGGVSYGGVCEESLLVFCTQSRREYLMKSLRCQVLAVFLVVAGLVPTAVAGIVTSRQWNVDKTRRALLEGAPVAVKILYSQGTTFHERRVTLIQSTLTSKTFGVRALCMCVLSSSSIWAEFGRVSRAGVASSAPLSATTGMSSTRRAGNEHNNQFCRCRDYGV